MNRDAFHHGFMRELEKLQKEATPLALAVRAAPYVAQFAPDIISAGTSALKNKKTSLGMGADKSGNVYT